MEVVKFGSRDEIKAAVIQTLREELSKPSSQPHGVMLSGGSTPLEIYNQIANNPFAIDAKAYITYSDERYVPVDSPDNNFNNTRPMLKALGVPDERVVSVKTELGHVESAKRFHNDLNSFFQKGSFALGFLGMGEDGHTASLFSLEDVQRGMGDWAIPVTKTSPPHRISVTREFLHKVEKLIILLTGKSKLEMLEVLLKKPESIPAGAATMDHPDVCVWYAD